MSSIGTKLRAARRERGLSLRELSSLADLSPSLISQVENDKSMPSVRSLESIAEALSLPLTYFFSHHAQGDELHFNEKGTDLPVESGSNRNGHSNVFKVQVLRSSDRPSLMLEGGISWMRLTAEEHRQAQFLELSYDPGASSNATLSYHNGQEFGIVLEGELTVQIGFEKHTLYCGDSIIFDATQPHRLTNTGDQLARAIWVVLSVSESENIPDDA